MEFANIWHVVPENDIEIHINKSSVHVIADNDGNITYIVNCECVCDPNIIYEQNGSIIIVHEAFDKRPQAYLNG